MIHLTKMSIAIDLYMLQLIEKDDANALTFRLPKSILDVYQYIVNSTGAKASFSEDVTDDSFTLEFTNADEQDKVWSHFYRFNQSGLRTYPMPNVYDTTNGELLTSELNEFVEAAKIELLGPVYQTFFNFNLDLQADSLDVNVVNTRFKNALGLGAKYVMLWDSELNVPSAVMIEADLDLMSVKQKFQKILYELLGIDDVWLDMLDLKIPVEIYPHFGGEDEDFWLSTAEKMRVIS